MLLCEHGVHTIAEPPFLPLVACALSVFMKRCFELVFKELTKGIYFTLFYSGLCFSQVGSIGSFQKEKEGKGDRRYLTGP